MPPCAFSPAALRREIAERTAASPATGAAEEADAPTGPDAGPAPVEDDHAPADSGETSSEDPEGAGEPSRP